MAREDFAVRTEGLTPLLRSLNKVNKGAGKEIKQGLREIAKKVRADAKPLAPKGTKPLPANRKVRLAGSIRYSATTKGASVGSALPQAPVLEYGGTIRPRGVPIKIKPHKFLTRAVQKDTAHIEEELGRLFDDLARSSGFR